MDNKERGGGQLFMTIRLISYQPLLCFVKVSRFCTAQSTTCTIEAQQHEATLVVLIFSTISLSNLQRQNYIDVATGSLGQGLSIAAGMAYCGKYYDKAR